MLGAVLYLKNGLDGIVKMSFAVNTTCATVYVGHQ